MTRQIGSSAARAWVEIDLGAIQRNAALLAQRAGVPILPMVKADAYGLGAVPVVRALEGVSPWGFGVATVDEGVELRDIGISRPIVVFTPLLADDFEDARDAELRPLLSREPDIRAWGSEQPWHLGIDTGMGRAGRRWDDVASLRDVLRANPPEGACTHFHSAELDDGSAELQERRFSEALEQLPARPRVLHTENGAAIARRERSQWTVVRPGIFLYGVGSGPGARVFPEAVVGVRSRIVDLREIRAGESVSYDATFRASETRMIATLPIGYADGVRRALSNKGSAIVKGRRVSIAGIVTMDMTMIDVTGIDCSVGDMATLIGRDGREEITVEDFARAGELSPYEVLTGLRQRLERRYFGMTAMNGSADVTVPAT